jgi:hypothetical protein
MVTKAKPAPEAEVTTEEPETKETSDTSLKDEVREIIKEVLPEFLTGGGSSEETTSTETETTGQTLTARQEEAQAHGLVTELIEGFKEAMAGEKKEPEKHEAETKPGAQPIRKIEKWLWGSE